MRVESAGDVAGAHQGGPQQRGSGLVVRSLASPVLPSAVTTVLDRRVAQESPRTARIDIQENAHGDSRVGDRAVVVGFYGFVCAPGHHLQ